MPNKPLRNQCCREPQFIFKPYFRITLEQEGTGSNKAIEKTRRLV